MQGQFGYRVTYLIEDMGQLDLLSQLAIRERHDIRLDSLAAQL
jgi:hypothetical protein